MNHLLCFGMGYCARALVQKLRPQGWRVTGTATSEAGATRIRAGGDTGIVFDGTARSAAVDAAIAIATHVIVSVPPGDAGDPVLLHNATVIEHEHNLRWIGYLSTVGVYGDHKGAWVDETTPTAPGSDRSRRRLEAENGWLSLAARASKHVQVFRLSGIYGPGRSAIDNLRDGVARRIVKRDQVFNRIHVDDVATVLAAAMTGRGIHQVYNVTDDEPAPPQDVIAFAAQLLKMEVPSEIPFDQAVLTPMGQSFYAENKRVRNERIKTDLGVSLSYPNFRKGLSAIASALRRT